MTIFICPVDGTVLVPMERQGIEIDHCPSCRGVWLDRGELDKIIERSSAMAPGPVLPGHSGHDRHLDRHGRSYDRYPPKRKRSFLEDLFD